MYPGGEALAPFVQISSWWLVLSTTVWGAAAAVGLGHPACHAEVFPGCEAAPGGSRQLGAPGGGPAGLPTKCWC